MILISTRPDETSKWSNLTACNFLLLNSDKIEILFIGPKNSTQNLLDYNLQLDRCTVTSSTVKSLGVTLDSNLSFENHISHVTKTAFHLRNIAKLRSMQTFSDAEKLVHALMTCRLDYCNASSINNLQIVQNAAARVLNRLRKYDHINPILQSLHWLPIKLLISYKILLLAYMTACSSSRQYPATLHSHWRGVDQHIPQATINNLINSMPRRCVALHEANGHHTRYWLVFRPHRAPPPPPIQ